MKKIVQLLFGIFFTIQLPAQNFTGQWKGHFTDNSTAFVGWGGDRCEYVLEIEVKGKNVTGYSYTYFSEGGKRYYTICKLKGTLNKAGRYVEVIETERTKTNVPVNIRNCFQIHRLTYFKQENDQTLEGTWVPVPNQNGDCGYGTTVLSRRILKKNAPVYNSSTARLNKPKPVNPIVKIKPKKVTPPPVAKNKPQNNPAVKFKTPDIAKNNTGDNDVENSHPVKTDPKNNDAGFEKRNSNLIKTIAIENETFNVDLYDNGDIDGDSISLFFNGKLLIANKRLSDKAITLKLNVDETRDMNELIMYAENLGSIPPNTALMVVTDGTSRYEVRISSDLQKSGVIRFVHKPKIKQ
ncbi:MAG TPA: hypothetical protein VK489_01915 [Ferruginibacter sp.]|nr:hypothetical protein [Ferruginibacter sp.]